MDTRTKILPSLVEAVNAAGADALVVSGSFDPLTAEHARRLNELAGTGTIVAVVLSSADPLLDGRARAELVAALSCVNSVVVQEPGMPGVIGNFKSVRDYDLHLRIREDLIEHVRRRHA